MGKTSYYIFSMFLALSFGIIFQDETLNVEGNSQTQKSQQEQNGKREASM
jgi:hypothetical protein